MGIVEELKSMDTIKAVVAELIGMALFVYIGTGAAFTNVGTGTAGQEDYSPYTIRTVEGQAFIWGLAYAAINMALAHSSGGHLNPIVSVAAMAVKVISPLKCGLLVVAQFAGGILGAAFQRAAHGSQFERQQLGANRIYHNSTLMRAIGIEAILSFFIVFVWLEAVWQTKNRNGNNAPLALGFSVMVAHAFAIPWTSAGLNPARSLGPALLANFWEDHWVFWLGPFVGMVFAVLLGMLLFKSGKEVAVTPNGDADDERGTQMRAVKP